MRPPLARAAAAARGRITRLAEGLADQGGHSETVGYPGDPQPNAALQRRDIAEGFSSARDVHAINPTPGPIPDLLES